jgi:hypothetical protein
MKNNMKNFWVLIIALCFVFIIYGFTCNFKKPVRVNADDLRTWINYLASDEMRGRANGSPEMNSAARWLADKFKEFELKPLLPNDDYVQNYSFSSRQHIVNEKNIIGLIRGTDPTLKDQYIILTAHFDHIGIRKGNEPDSICNGADDNASGTCTLLGIAKTIMDSRLKPGRTIVFATFSGEESGMRGSRYFTANPPLELSKIYADINFEMTGHSEFLGKNRYYMTGCKISDLDDQIGEYNRKSEWQLIDTIPLANNLFFASDNIAFSAISVTDGIRHGIPSGTFATTALSDYLHSPRDEGKYFDYDNMAGLVEYFSGLVIWLSRNKRELHFTDPSFAKLK